MEDSMIVSLYWDRDERAITETDNKYGSRLNSIAYNVTRNREDAEECVNDTYNATWNSIPTARPEYFFAYIAKIVRNLALDLYDKAHAVKRNATVVELSDELANLLPSGDDFEKRADTEEITAVINELLTESSPDMRKVFVRRYWYMDQIDDIAVMYSMSESKVKSILHRMRKSLKQKLSEAGIWM